MRSTHVVLAAATALSITWCGTGWADEATEKALEQKLAEMQKQIDEMAKNMKSDGSSRAGDDLAARVDELEKLTKKDKDGLFGYWGSGLKMDSANGAFKLHVGGRIQSDWSWFNHTAEAEGVLGTQIEAGEEFRRARLAIDGTIYGNVIFSNEYDFAGGAVALRDVWVGVKNLPFGQVQVGNMKEPTGTEELTSDLFIPFLERSAGNEAFAPDYKTGFMASSVICDQWSYQLGMFRDSGGGAGAGNGNSTGNTRSGDYNFTGRFAGKPWAEEDGSSYATVGVAASVRSPTKDTVQFRSRPELHLAPRFVDTGAFAADRETLLEADAGFVSGPFWAFGDVFSVNASRVDDSNVTFKAWQLAAGWFLTGETKPYKAANSTYDRPKPKSNFDGNGGSGAWELAARYDQLDLNDSDVEGGKVNNLTVGVSWYLNPNTRWMLDWVHTKQKDKDISINGIEMRVQIDF